MRRTNWVLGTMKDTRRRSTQLKSRSREEDLHHSQKMTNATWKNFYAQNSQEERRKTGWTNATLTIMTTTVTLLTILKQRKKSQRVNRNPPDECNEKRHAMNLKRKMGKVLKGQDLKRRKKNQSPLSDLLLVKHDRQPRYQPIQLQKKAKMKLPSSSTGILKLNLIRQDTADTALQRALVNTQTPRLHLDPPFSIRRASKKAVKTIWPARMISGNWRAPTFEP
jgi:hypothetical protein